MERKNRLDHKLKQNNLRRLMLEQRQKLETKTNTLGKVDSLLAKYDSDGNLKCIICRTIVKPASVWKVHLNSKKHKQNLEIAKSIKSNNVVEKSLSPQKTNVQDAKRNAPNLKKESNTDKFVPLLQNKNEVVPPINPPSNTAETSSSILPEHFFDDPIKDAKIRNIEYKDPQDEEWLRFQKELKEESTMSSAIIAGDQEVTAINREIEEIDEQMLEWSKVISLERKKKLVFQKEKRRKNNVNTNSPSSSSDESDLTHEFSDWRSKKF